MWYEERISIFIYILQVKHSYKITHISLLLTKQCCEGQNNANIYLVWSIHNNVLAIYYSAIIYIIVLNWSAVVANLWVFAVYFKEVFLSS